MIDPAALRAIFDRAASLSAPDRATFLADACSDNPALRREVERLLAADAKVGHVLTDRPLDDTPSEAPTRLDAGERLALAPGTRLGPYEVVSALGAGGMGEVYRARDGRLNRTVAIKVLPADLSDDPVARQRFEREARAVAALAHPHICPLFDIGRHGTRDYLVMEFEEGETLAARLARGRLPLDEALRYAGEIADALAAAHRNRIVHRDLKPGNIMLTAAGVKLLDFGLAKHGHEVALTERTAASSAPLTASGMILGTIRYMAPEQLSGLPADERSDIFAFGVVLYEMVTGRRAFDGPSDAAVIGNILHAEPPSPSSIERLTPHALDGLVQRCLSKDPGARPQEMRVVASELPIIRQAVEGGSRGRAFERPSAYRWLALALLAGCALLGAGYFVMGRSATPAQVTENSLDSLRIRPLTLTGDVTSGAISPDGKFVAFVRKDAGIWIRQTADDHGLQLVPHSKGRSQSSVTFTPDGQAVDYAVTEGAVRNLWRVPLLGGTPRLVIENIWSSPGWSSDGQQMAFIRASGIEQPNETSLVVADANGGHQRVVVTRSFREGFLNTGWFPNGYNRPGWSPDNTKIVLAAAEPAPNISAFVVIDVQAGRTIRKIPLDSGGLAWEASFLSKDTVLLNLSLSYGTPGSIWSSSEDGTKMRLLTQDFAEFIGVSLSADRHAVVSAREDARSGLWSGDAIGTSGETVVPETRSGPRFPKVDNSGKVIYEARTSSGSLRLSRLAHGEKKPETIMEGAAAFFSGFAIDPFGRWLIFTAERPEGLTRLEFGKAARTTLFAGNAAGPVVEPDSRALLFSPAGEGGLYRISSEGGIPTKLSDVFVGSIPSISPDGRHVMFSGSELGWVHRCSLPNCSNPEKLQLRSHIWAPSGQGVAYIDDQDNSNIWEQPFDGTPARPITKFTTGSRIFEFAWSADYKRLAVTRGSIANDLVLLTGVR